MSFRRLAPLRPGLVLVALVVVFLAGCARKPAGPLDQELDRLFSTAAQKGLLSGNVLVTRGEATLYEKSFGQADRARRIPNTAATRFRAFSLLEPLTATLVFQQIEAGRLRLTDTLDRFLPALAGRAAGRITLQQLLTHTSGLPDLVNQHRSRRITPEDLAAAALKSPGSFARSNTGYVCLGLVLEAVTGNTFAALLQEKILGPAGMADSGLIRAGSRPEGLAENYPIATDTTPTRFDESFEALDGSASLYTTARDLRRFDRALKGGKLLSPSSQDLMLTAQVEKRYGYGWYVAEQAGNPFPWYRGEYRGYLGWIARLSPRDEVVVILFNQENIDLFLLRKTLALLESDPTGKGSAP